MTQLRSNPPVPAEPQGTAEPPVTTAPAATSPAAEHPRSADGAKHYVDFLVIGAGVSGIGISRFLQKSFPGRSIAVLEAKDNFGGTWWTHRFPGIRSDSDLFTYGFRDRPWTGPSIATAEEIRKYLSGIIDDDDLAPLIHYNHTVTALEWSSDDNLWTATVLRTDTGDQLHYVARFLWMCHGYYDHDDPYQPEWPGTDTYRGRLVHPENWPDDLDYAGKKVLVIGSGATAITMCPVIAQTAEHVTMLQRSPSYYLPAPRQLELADALAPLDLPEEWTHEILRRQYILQSDLLIETSKSDPDEARAFFIDGIRELVPAGTDIDKHFTPSYRPWQQRVVVTPDGEFFERMRAGKLSVVTDEIETFVENGVQLASGEVIEADIVASATGFTMTPFGNIPFQVDGELVDFTERLAWRGMMIEGIPNMAFAMGYFRASWTLRVDLITELMGRVLHELGARNAAKVVPEVPAEDADMPRLPWVTEDNVSSGYMMRALHRLHRQGDRDPWRQMLDYAEERETLPAARVDDGLSYS